MPVCQTARYHDAIGVEIESEAGIKQPAEIFVRIALQCNQIQITRGREYGDRFGFLKRGEGGLVVDHGHHLRRFAGLASNSCAAALPPAKRYRSRYKLERCPAISRDRM